VRARAIARKLAPFACASIIRLRTEPESFESAVSVDTLRRARVAGYRAGYALGVTAVTEREQICSCGTASADLSGSCQGNSALNEPTLGYLPMYDPGMFVLFSIPGRRSRGTDRREDRRLLMRLTDVNSEPVPAARRRRMDHERAW
jgi:hypothetical protein